MPKHRLAVLSAFLVLAACDADRITENDAELAAAVSHDVAAASADDAADDVEQMGGPSGALGFGLMAPAVITGPFCGDRSRDGLTVSRTCTFKDALGAVQAAYDPATTASVQIEVVIDGTITRLHWEAELHRERDLTVSGLAGDETSRTWNGTGAGEITRSRHRENGATRTYEISYTTTITSVVVPHPRTDDSWPTSGTITRTVHVEVIGGPNDGRVFDRQVTITFNGTKLVPLTVGDQTYTLNLETRRIVEND